MKYPRNKRQKSPEMNETAAKMVAKELNYRAERDKKTNQEKYEITPYDVHGDRILSWGVKKYVKLGDDWYSEGFVEW